MRVTSSNVVRIRTNTRVLEDTIAIYREAVAYFLQVLVKEVDVVPSKHEGVRLLERLCHRTKKNPAPRYAFDAQFYKMPSYFRRAAISSAIGILQSHETRMAQWAEEKEDARRLRMPFKKRPPRIGYTHAVMPVFYQSKNGIFRWVDETTVRLKVYKSGDWVWETVHMQPSDARHIQDAQNAGYTISSPTLRKCHRRYEMVFAITQNVDLREKDPTQHTIVSVDLGYNSLATCIGMRPDGTVDAPYFFKGASEKDRLYHLLNKKKRFQKEGKGTGAIYREIRHLQDRMTLETAKAIVAYARYVQADCIVMEHLSLHFTGARKPYREKLHLWRKRGICTWVEHLAHKEGMRFSTVNPRNTSRLAYDGSGEVLRDPTNYTQCTFSNGKQYNADLNAAKNIGARYYIRAYKTQLETLGCAAEANALLPAQGTKSTLSDLIAFIAARKTRAA